MSTASVFFKDTATTEIYTLSLHDALPISRKGPAREALGAIETLAMGAELALSAVNERRLGTVGAALEHGRPGRLRSEEHTSELQSRQYLVCRLLLEKKRQKQGRHWHRPRQ